MTNRRRFAAATRRHGFLFVALIARVAPGQNVDSARTAFVRELVAATSSRDSATLRSLLRGAMATDTSAAFAESYSSLMTVGEQARGLTIVRLDTTPNGRGVTVRASAVPRSALLNVAWYRNEPTRLRIVQLLKAWNPATEKLKLAPPRSVREIPQQLDAHIVALAKIGAFSGTVLVARNDSVVFTRGYGLANLDDSVRNTPDTRYHLASMGKMFTAVAIGQLMEAGKLRLDDTLAHVLPDYPNTERAAQITIRHLLAHTAGLGDIWSHPAYRRDSAYRSNRELAWVISTGPLQFAPGTHWAYSNEGFTVLGAIVERLSGESFESYMRNHIWGPARMTGVAIAGGDRTLSRRAIGYAPADDDLLGIASLRPQLLNVGPTSFALGAGGEYATVADFLRFSSALKGGRLLKRSTLDSLVAPRSPFGRETNVSYGLGFMRFEIAGNDYAGHGGGGGYGIDNMLYFSVSGPWTIVVLGNHNPPEGSDLALTIAQFIAGAEQRVTLKAQR